MTDDMLIAASCAGIIIGIMGGLPLLAYGEDDYSKFGRWCVRAGQVWLLMWILPPCLRLWIALVFA